MSAPDLDLQVVCGFRINVIPERVSSVSTSFHPGNDPALVTLRSLDHSADATLTAADARRLATALFAAADVADGSKKRRLEFHKDRGHTLEPPAPDEPAPPADKPGLTISDTPEFLKKFTEQQRFDAEAESRKAFIEVEARAQLDAKKARADAALAELTRLTEELGGYDAETK